MAAVRPDVADGFVALYDPKDGELRVVADGFRFTNEIRFDANEQWLYVVETCGPCITRLKAAPGGTLTDRQTFGPADHGALIDGIAFDTFGNLWGTHIMKDRVFALTPDGELRILLDDAPVEASQRLMEAFYNGQATPELMLACSGSIAPWMASVTFFGRDLRQVAIGSLKGTRLPVFTAPVAGLPMQHWNDAIGRSGRAAGHEFRLAVRHVLRHLLQGLGDSALPPRGEEWRPGTFDGANAGENIEISANGRGATLTRDIGVVTMNLTNLETIDVNALVGADTITVNDRSKTSVNDVAIDLSATRGSGVGDGVADTVVVNATDANDIVNITEDNGVVRVSGLATKVTISGFDTKRPHCDQRPRRR